MHYIGLISPSTNRWKTTQHGRCFDPVTQNCMGQKNWCYVDPIDLNTKPSDFKCVVLSSPYMMTAKRKPRTRSFSPLTTNYVLTFSLIHVVNACFLMYQASIGCHCELQIDSWLLCFHPNVSQIQN